MKAADRLAARLGANIDESMGARRGSGGSVAPAGFSVAGTDPSAIRYEGSSRIKGALNIEVDRLAPDPNQPRRHFDDEALQELAASLKTRGQLQPIRVRWDEGLNQWFIVTGERRWRAAKLAGLKEIACVEQREDRGEIDRLEDQLVENCVREDLSPIEQANAFRALLDARGCSIRQLAEVLNISHQSVLRSLKLLELPEDLRGRVHDGQLAPSVATELAAVPGDDERRALADLISTEKLNRDQAVEVIREATEKAGVAPSSKATRARASGRSKKAREHLAPGRFLVDGGLVVEVTTSRPGARPPGPADIARALREALAQAEAALTGESSAA